MLVMFVGCLNDRRSGKKEVDLEGTKALRKEERK